MRSCPSCGKQWSSEHEVCPDCLAALVDDLAATITCRSCGHVCPSRMQTCPECFALLRLEDIDQSAELARAADTGHPRHRPVGRGPFEEGVGCTIQRVAARSTLLLVGEDGYIEASVGAAAQAPMRCVADDVELFRLVAYGAADDALVAVGPDGAPLATFLRHGSALHPWLDVRDETSAPVGRFERGPDGFGYQLVETGGTVVADGERDEVEHDGWMDDEWTITPIDEVELPLEPMAFVALVVAAKALLGMPVPITIPDP